MPRSGSSLYLLPRGTTYCDLPGLETELQRLDKEDEAVETREEMAFVLPVSVTSVVSDSVYPSNVIPESVSPVVVPISTVHRSSRLLGGVGVSRSSFSAYFTSGPLS